MLTDEFHSLDAFIEYFHSEERCIEVLFPMRWPNGFECPRCANREYTSIQTRRLPLYQCRSCHYQATLTSGTIMDKSRTPIRKWLAAIWLVSQSSSSINATQLRLLISVTYKTAWAMLNKIRYSIGEADANESLSGLVSGIVSFYGKPYNPSALLHSEEHPLIIAASIDPNGNPLYLKAKLVPRKQMSDRYVTTPAYRSFIEQHTLSSVEQTSIIRERCRITKNNPFKLISQQITTWINNNFHSIGESYLQQYLDEFCFRRNVKQQNFYSPWELLARHCMRASF